MKENLRDDLKMYLITDSDILKGRDFYKCIEDGLKAGVTMLQLREKNADGGEFLEKALKFVHGDPQVLYFYAVVQANLNKIDEAKRILNSIVLAYPEFVQARQVLTALNKGQTLVP